MSRRETEIACGSDSFLDVIANIVGILIVLIVIAGMRVGNQEVTVPLSALPAVLVGEPEEGTIPIIADVSTENDPEAVDIPIPELVIPEDMVGQAQELEEQLAVTEKDSRLLAEALARAQSQQTTLEQRLQTARELLAERKNQMQVATDRDMKHKEDLELARRTVAGLQAQLTEAQRQAAPAVKLQHRITPISKTVLGRELHFRLENNRVAEVPIEALVERLKDHIERRKDWIAKTGQHKGQVGPINGFNLEYLLGVETMGGAAYRMNLRYWEVRPEPTLRGEGEDVATKQGSKFYQALLSSSPDTTLTFWVYPDSYSLYRKLQAFAHEHGFLVAGRPLPPGVSISGSPNGTKSAGQ